jgi:4-amino-4-deoxy-L-arabinose transferase-like glycosyltransferase
VRWWPLLALLPGLWALRGRPPLPLDELRYLTVGWEMWQRGDFLVPHLNGEPYSHKPPVLFWLMHAGWAAFGVNEWWPRLIGPLCAVAAAGLAARLARRLWPGDAAPALVVPWLLAGAMGWAVLGQMLMFDMLLTVWVLVGIAGVWQASRSGRLADFAAVAAAILAGVLTKGPVVLIQVLVPALLAPWWSASARARPVRWYALVLASGIAGLLAAGIWALPAAAAGGSDYASALLWRQTAGRMQESFAHAAPWYAYALFLPAMLLPWIAWPRLWRSARRARFADDGTRFVAGWAGSVTIALSLLSAKQAHYALPVVAAFALLIARLVTANGLRLPPWRLAAATVVTVLIAGTVFFFTRGAGQDLHRPARAIAALQESGAEVFVYASYKGQVGFLGRLRQPFGIVPRGTEDARAAQHPGAYLVQFEDDPLDRVSLELASEFPYRGRRMRIWHVAKPENPS